MTKYQQGKYKPHNPQKYKGDPSNIVYRSSWELSVCQFFDMHPSVIEWSSESTIVGYVSPVDNRGHRYYIDFSVKMKDREGNIKSFLIEVKPEHEIYPPERKNKKQNRFINEVLTFGINQAKWKAAIKHARKKGQEFVVLTKRGNSFSMLTEKEFINS